ncbi:Lamin Tail Domain [Pseudozobellia thermophila]|uniref:Lamin Tail Domain n=1 Tax=Pseudozobellia thermophila TaxID=192903 RepID=A0A1M6ATM4_9FLAO|nr:Lamin Tail Domain [Pseudozobellia thermophila]
MGTGLRYGALLGSVLLFLACVKGRDFDKAADNCVDKLTANATFEEVRGLYSGSTVQITEDLVIEGYVISSDKEGNFYGTLYFQDRPSDSSDGFLIEIDLRDSHLFYPVGSKIFIKLRGLYLGQSRNVYKLGATFESFGTVSVGRLPSAAIGKHIFVSCQDPVPIEPTLVFLDALDERYTGTLVQLQNMEVAEEEVGLPFAVAEEETLRTLVDCADREIELVNSGYSDFYSKPLPEGNGLIQGVLIRENDDYRLVVRSIDDISFTGDRCEDVVDEFTSTSVFISELADPDNNASARFVELFNASDQALSLKGWTIRRYTNANTEVGSSIDLTGYTIGGRSTFLISPNPEEFEKVYGFFPDLGARTNSPADSNGDDNLELVDPFGTVIDVFGVVGEDGSGTDHEFEDGRALRRPEVARANPVYTFSEWEIYNDTGGSGTVNEPKSAPDDFTPGLRN